MRIGFAGLGRMGAPMAARLADAGHTVIAYDIALLDTRTLPEPLCNTGIQVATNPAELGDANISISMLPTAAITDTVLFGPDGILPTAHEGHIHVVMGTVGPAAVVDFAQRAASAGVLIADAPVSGSVALAETGQLTAIVGADRPVFERLRPVLAQMAARQFHVGPVGSGSTAKVAVNTVLAGLNEAIAEGMLLASAGGVSFSGFYDVLASSAVAAPYVDYKRQNFLDPDGSDVAFTLALLNKDVTLGLTLAEEHGLDLPQARTVGRVLDQAMESGLGQRDMAAVLEWLRRESQRSRPVRTAR